MLNYWTYYLTFNEGKLIKDNCFLLKLFINLLNPYTFTLNIDKKGTEGVINMFYFFFFSFLFLGDILFFLLIKEESESLVLVL